jgi:amino-acid N-acetyltransferase
VVVAQPWRCRGLADLLVNDRIQAARAASLHAVYLLTTTAVEYFASRRFRAVLRAQVPAELRSSPEFTSICPASAACLKRELSDSSPNPS